MCKSTHTLDMINFLVSTNDTINSCRELLDALFPNNTFDLKIETGGITNILVKATCKNLSESTTIVCKKTLDILLVRVYGPNSEILIDRNAEFDNFKLLSSLNIASTLYARFTNGFVYEYIKGKTISSLEMAKDDISCAIAKEMARYHSVKNVTENKKSLLFPTIHRWMNLLSDTLDGESFTGIKNTLDKLESRVSKDENEDVRFCHCDLLSGNIILTQTDPVKVSFIDYEYSMMAPIAFDIANHFAEYAGFECDYSRLPNMEFQKKWIGNYLKVDSQSATREEIDSLYNNVQEYINVAHLYWCVWAFVQSRIKGQTDFDYLEYAILRLNHIAF
jgi:ethanolamine kinase